MLKKKGIGNFRVRHIWFSIVLGFGEEDYWDDLGYREDIYYKFSNVFE